MRRLSIAVFFTFTTALAGCASAPPPPAQDAPAPGGEPKGYGYEFIPDSVKDTPATPAPPAQSSVKGRLPPETIQGIVRQSFPKFKECYEAGLKKDPKLAGDVKVHFVIGEDGKVSGNTDEASTLPDKEVVACIVGAFSAISFPKPEGGIVTVVYPIQFSP